MVGVKCSASSAADSSLSAAAGSRPTSTSQPCSAASLSRMPSDGGERDRLRQEAEVDLDRLSLLRR